MPMIGPYSFEQYLTIIESFHGSTAPGLVLGGFMVDCALDNMPKDLLLDVICETTACLPDAVQLLTPCTTGNGWMKVLNLGRYALSVFEKFGGEGVRVFVDAEKLEAWPDIREWLFKLKPKKEQDKERLLAQMREAGRSLFGIQPVRIQPRFLGKKKRGSISTCTLCGEPYPQRDGAICRACQGESPYVSERAGQIEAHPAGPALEAVPLDQAVGQSALHDMTRVVPGESKGPFLKQGWKLQAADMCSLQLMGRERIYVAEKNRCMAEWVHENAAAVAFAKSMAGEGTTFEEPPSEGKINIVADRDGLFVADVDRLERFNTIPGVMCASRKNCSVVQKGRPVAATRAIPLFLHSSELRKALAELNGEPIFEVFPLRKARVGILVTGNEVFRGLIEDKFAPIITAKVEKYECGVVGSIVAPDDRKAISDGIDRLVGLGADLLVTTAGLSVDPDDVTRQGLIDAGAADMVYGTPVVPGAMLLVARIGDADVIGVPACALFFKTTGFDLLLPRILAGRRIARGDLAKMAHGGLCLGCKTCTFPKCPFGG